MVSIMAVLVTRAFFSDTETSTGNKFVAGALDLKVSSECTYNGSRSEQCGNWGSNGKDLVEGDKFFNFSDNKPGDYGENTIDLAVDNDARACLTLDNMHDNDPSLTEPESTAGDLTLGTDKGELAPELHFVIWADDGDNVKEENEAVLTSGSAADVLNGKVFDLGTLSSANKTYYGVYWCYGKLNGLPNGPYSCDGSAVTNMSQTDSLVGDIKFYVEQARNNPNFKCPELPKLPEVVYDTYPNPLPGNFPSQAFEATSTSEFGGQVTLTGTKRSDPKVTVMMSSWGCENGNWFNNNCSTTPGTTFSEPITLNLYNVGGGNQPGTLIVTKTLTFNIPFRPSADNVNCTGGNAGKWFDGTNCNNGFATPVDFDLAGMGVNLPNNVIVAVAYNTSHYGYAPYGQATACYGVGGGCGYDSLNVAAKTNPLVTYPIPNDAYLNSSWGGAYCDNGSGGTGLFRLDAGCWTGYQPVFKVVAY